jgi:hypothetical protein
MCAEFAQHSLPDIIIGFSVSPHASGKHKIVSGGPFGLLDFHSGTKSQECQKRKFLLHGALKIVYPVYHSKQESKKKKIKVFYLVSKFFISF